MGEGAGFEADEVEGFVDFGDVGGSDAFEDVVCEGGAACGLGGLVLEFLFWEWDRE